MASSIIINPLTGLDNSYGSVHAVVKLSHYTVMSQFLFHTQLSYRMVDSINFSLDLSVYHIKVAWNTYFNCTFNWVNELNYNNCWKISLRKREKNRNAMKTETVIAQHIDENALNEFHIEFHHILQQNL